MGIESGFIKWWSTLDMRWSIQMKVGIFNWLHANGSSNSLQVKDDGIGVKEEDIPKIIYWSFFIKGIKQEVRLEELD